MDNAWIDLNSLRRQLPWPLLDLFRATRSRWRRDGPWEAPFSDWLDLFDRVGAVRSAGTEVALLTLADEFRSLGLLDAHRGILSILVGPCHAVAEVLIRCPRSPDDSETASSLLRICPPDGWRERWLDLLEVLFDDEPDLEVARELAARASEESEADRADRETRRSLRMAARLLQKAARSQDGRDDSPEELPELLTAEHISEILGITVIHARRQMADGTIPAHKHGRRWFARREEFLKMFDPKRPRRRRF